MMKGETVLSGAPHPNTPLRVMRSEAGHYLGYCDESGQPYTRESMYFDSVEEAQGLLAALRGYER